MLKRGRQKVEDKACWLREGVFRHMALTVVTAGWEVVVVRRVGQGQEYR